VKRVDCDVPRDASEAKQNARQGSHSREPAVENKNRHSDEIVLNERRLLVILVDGDGRNANVKDDPEQQGAANVTRSNEYGGGS
jgi:hypothetical protein